MELPPVENPEYVEYMYTVRDDTEWPTNQVNEIPEYYYTQCTSKTVITLYLKGSMTAYTPWEYTQCIWKIVITLYTDRLIWQGV